MDIGIVSLDDSGFDAFLFEEGDGFLGVVALELDIAGLDGTAAAEGGFEFGEQLGEVVGGVLKASDEGDFAVAFAFLDADSGDLIFRRYGGFGREGEAGGESVLLLGRKREAAALRLRFATAIADGWAVEGCAGEEAGHRRLPRSKKKETRRKKSGWTAAYAALRRLGLGAGLDFAAGWRAWFFFSG